MPHPFRFGTFPPGNLNHAGLVEFAHKVESLGYGYIASGEHAAAGVSGPLVMLATLAAATTSVQLTSHVFNNELRHPALLAGELAMLDQMSNGRVAIGLGGGWLRLDFDMLGIPFASGGQRIARLEEAIQLIKRLYGDEPVTLDGTFYRVQGLMVSPRPLQRPYPPFCIAGGGKRVLTLAAREAQIIGIDPTGTPEGGKDLATSTPEAFDQKLAWVKEAAGDRFAEIEFDVNVLVAVVTDNWKIGAAQAVAWFAALPPGVLSNVPADDRALLALPHILVGSVNQICEKLLEQRERHYISRVTVPPESIENFAPVVARLRGT